MVSVDDKHLAIGGLLVLAIVVACVWPFSVAREIVIYIIGVVSGLATGGFTVWKGGAKGGPANPGV
jgi:hypothetical protein